MGRAILLVALALAAVSPAPAEDNKNRLVFADFQQIVEGRPVSSRGGLVWLYSYQENQRAPTKITNAGTLTPPAPELVRLKAEDPNRAATFDFELSGPNQFAGVGIEVLGNRSDGQKLAADDLSAYKFVQLDVYATGVSAVRLELISRGHGVDLFLGYPQVTFKVKPGLNTYKLKLDSFKQPFWAPQVGVKRILKALTSVTLSAFCEQCTGTKGTVVVDNIVFER